VIKVFASSPRRRFNSGVSAPWTAEATVTPDEAIRLLEAQFPALSPVRVQELGTGWDNTAYLANDTYVVRFPRRQVAVPLIAAEAQLLPLIAEHVKVPVPQPVLLGQPSASYPWPFLGHRLLPGQTACRANLDETARARLAAALGAFLRDLHAIPTQQAAALGAVGDVIGRLELPRKVSEAREFLGAIADADLPVARADVAAALERATNLSRSDETVLVHGDLYARHILIDDALGFAGVIDWGDVHLGHPAVDLAIGFGFVPPAARDDFFAAYACPVPPATLALARFRALYSALAILRYGRAQDDADLVREGRRAVVNVLV
jgi:aminoglycoside phosphotransferase (APT) family kinase protein